MPMKRLLTTLCLAVALVGSSLAQIRDSVTFAVFGNSISTYYEDYIPSGYAIYYGQGNELTFGVQVGDTWWMQLSRLSGMTFLANSSWSGSRVAFIERNSDISPFCSNARIVSLARNGVPDVILIAAGTNDWGHNNVPLGDYSTTVYNDSLTFRGAYALMLHKLTTRYPDTKIVCLSLFPRGNGLTEKNGQGWSQSEANTSIRTIARQFGAKYIDCSAIAFATDWNTYTIDRLHPKPAGHKLIADCISKALVSQGVITRALAANNEVDEADCLLDLSFDATGIVNKGTYSTTVGSRGSATTVYDPETQTYMGCTKAANGDFFYALYDEGTPLANAFNQCVTWEALLRLDNLANGSNSCEKVCFLSNEQNGGWSFYNSRYAVTFNYTNASGVKSSMKTLAGDSIMIPGRFAHLVCTMDRRSHIMRFFVNGALVCTGTRAGTDMPLPRCGTSIGRKGMWIALGGDCSGGNFRTSAENGAATTFVFARIYDGALTLKAAKALYNDYVKQFTEPSPVISNGLVLDCQFTPDGARNLAASYLDRPVVKMGDVTTSYNRRNHFYSARFSGVKTQLFKYDLGSSPTIMNSIADAYSLEVYCSAESALPTASMKPAGFTNGYGAGLQMNAKGAIGFTTTTMGYRNDGTAGKTQWQWTDAGMLTDDYTHYVVVYDRRNHLSALYVDGEKVASRVLNFKEGSLFEWAPTEWLAIGGDASGKYDASTNTGSYPFRGDIAYVRMWGKALTASDVHGLNEAIKTEQVTYTIGGNGYVGACVPFATVIPEGISAYIVVEVDGTYAYLKQVGENGEVIPYGTPLILKGEKKTTVSLGIADFNEPDAVMADVEGNLLVGTFASMTLTSGKGYYQNTTGAGLYRASTNVKLPAFSCYMPSDLRRTLLTYKDDETGINTPEGTDAMAPFAAPWYDLQGRKVSRPANGIFIQGGRKVVK